MKRQWKHVDTEMELGVAVFTGNKGDRKVDQYIKEYPRRLVPFSTGLVQGSLLREIAPHGQRLYKPGDTTEDDPDIVPGFAQCCCMEDATVLICIGPISKQTGTFAWRPMGKKTHRANTDYKPVTIKQGHVVAISFGVVQTTKGDLAAPAVIVAKNGPVDVIMAPGSVMMEGWKETV